MSLKNGFKQFMAKDSEFYPVSSSSVVRESKLGQRLKTNELVTTEAEQRNEIRGGRNSLAEEAIVIAMS